ncbi:MAG: hypothetical protein KDE26_12005 [Bacteroidetes bacterium]|nr:hypothetical protein [Bacteroidota bacterium]
MNEYLKKWNDELDDLHVDFSIDQEEVVEKFEKHKSSMREYLVDLANKIDEKAKGLDVKDKADNVKAKIEELQVQLALGKAESQDAYEEQKKNLDKKLHEAQKEYEKLKSEGDEKLHHLASDFHSQAEKFKTKMDVFRLHFALGTADAKDELAEKKEELKEKLAEMKKKVEENKEKAEEKWDEFSEELSESYNHFKGAIKNLFS